MRGKSVAILALWTFFAAGTVLAADPDYEVQRGDTLWDLSGRFWSDVAEWPELWALNPHFRNPHWILPGDPIFLDRLARAQQGERGVFRLPLERLQPGGGAGTDGGDAGASALGGGRGQAAPGGGRAAYLLTDRQCQDYVAPERPPRWGTIKNLHQIKVYYGAGEDVEFAVNPDIGLRAGDVVTVIDDRDAVTHPVTRKLSGYYVQVLAQMEVLAVHGEKAVGRLLTTYDTVEDGDGVIAYRPSRREIALRQGPTALEGVILRGHRNHSMFSTDDVVFLDRGSKDGLEPGVLLEINVREGERIAQGIVDLGEPLATLLVVTVEERSAAGVVVESRAALESGDRFVVAAFSP